MADYNIPTSVYTSYEQHTKTPQQRELYERAEKVRQHAEEWARSPEGQQAMQELEEFNKRLEEDLRKLRKIDLKLLFTPMTI